MAKEIQLRIRKAKAKLLTELEHLNMIKPAICGGINTAYENWHFLASNQNILNYNSTEDQEFGFCVDGNSL